MEGQSLEQLFAGRLDLDLIKARLRQAAQDAGLPIGDRKMTYNSRLAQELSKWAESKGKGTEFHHRAFKAYFADGINIGSISELASIAQEIGLSGEEAEEVLRTRRFKEAVDLDWVRSHQKGVHAVPTFLLRDRTLVGAQPYEKIAAFVEAAGVKKRK
jgi:predicted DsbA family dithiol-disulfide isomerase